jgi:hypothetical protein
MFWLKMLTLQNQQCNYTILYENNAIYVCTKSDIYENKVTLITIRAKNEFAFLVLTFSNF